VRQPARRREAKRGRRNFERMSADNSHGREVGERKLALMRGKIP